MASSSSAPLRRATPYGALLLFVCICLAVPNSWAPLSALGAWLCALVTVSRRDVRRLFSLEWLFLVLLGLFHLGLVVPVAVGVTPERYWCWLDSPYVGPALRLFGFACLAFAAGACAAPVRRSAEDRMPASGHVFWGGMLVAGVGAAVLWVGATQLGLLSIGYGEYWEAAVADDVRLFGFGLMLFPVGILISAVGATPRQLRVVTVLYAAVFSPLFLGGFRGHVIVHGVALIAVWGRKDGRGARRLAVCGGAALIVLAPAVKVARNWEASLAEAVATARPLELVMEMGGSLRPLVHTSELLEVGGEPLWLGKSYMQALARVLPNLSLDWATDGDARQLTPSNWVTSKSDPWVYERGGGIGFSAVAEPFLNFGWIGVPIYFGLLGYALRRGDQVLSSYRPHATPIVAASFGFVLWSVRNDLTGVPRPVVVSMVAVYAIGWAARIHKRTRHQQSPLVGRAGSPLHRSNT